MHTIKKTLIILSLFNSTFSLMGMKNKQPKSVPITKSSFKKQGDFTLKPNESAKQKQKDKKCCCTLAVTTAVLATQAVVYGCLILNSPILRQTLFRQY